MGVVGGLKSYKVVTKNCKLKREPLSSLSGNFLAGFGFDSGSCVFVAHIESGITLEAAGSLIDVFHFLFLLVLSDCIVSHSPGNVNTFFKKNKKFLGLSSTPAPSFSNSIRKSDCVLCRFAWLPF